MLAAGLARGGQDKNDQLFLLPRILYLQTIGALDAPGQGTLGRRLAVISIFQLL